MASGTVERPTGDVTTYTTGSTSSSDIVYNSSVITALNRANVARNGNIVVLSFVCSVSSQSGTSTLFTIPSSLAPASQIDFLIGNASSEVYNGTISQVSGTWAIRSISSLTAGSIRGQVSWIIGA